MKARTLYLVALVVLVAAASTSTSPAASRRGDRIQVLYREDVLQDVWNVYVFGAICEEGKLKLYEPANPRVEPLRIECTHPRE